MAERPLIGLSPDQVSTNGMLGDLAFQDSDSAYIETIRGKVSLDKLDKSIEDTAVDIFVYDTRKDSDGGAWRKRTQHTSWYNETLNTSIRGSRREFPAVAVIVLIHNYVIIYDGDDPDLPMWMKIPRNAGAATYWYGFGSAFPTATSIYAMNGIIAATHTDPNNSSGGVALIRFIHDNFYRYGINNGNGGTSTINISERESSTSFPDTPTGTLVDWKANDVAMTVLPNAPIDDATGLSVPTIAVATNGGVSVIKDNGTVVDITWSSYGIASSVYFKDNYLWLTNDSGIFYKGGRYLKKYSIPSSDISESHGYLRNSALKYWASPWPFLGSYTGTSYPPLLGSKLGFYGPTVGPYWGSSDGTNGGITFIGDEGTTTTNGLVAYATTSYNTGWMHGDIKGAFLSDTDATNVTGSELVTNGDFSSALGSTWTAEAGGTTIAINSGVLDVSRSGSGSSGQMSAYQQVTGLTVGEIYVLTGEVTAMSHEASIGIARNVTGTGYDPNNNNEGYYLSDNWTVSNGINSPGTITVTFRAAETSYYIGLGARTSSTATASFDNISLRKAEYDRSVNQKGLQVFGTITKSAVATGAELVAYGPFTDSNYLRQPYNSDMNFGTGAFSVCLWIKPDTNTPYMRIINRVTDGSNNRWELYTDDGQNNITLYTRNGGAQSNVSVSGDAIPLDIWTHVCGVRESNGDLKVYLNGQLRGTSTIGSGANPSIRDLTSTTANLLIGNAVDWDVDNAFDGQLALVRISASAPTAAQVKKMYEDEKVLFQENAACTLYGSSDAVTALAYDDSTSILYAGTSSGRSDFQGLRRINNTTTAVTTAMSASNGLVAEQ